MRIAQVSSPHERTPPIKYGGVERIVSLLTEGLVARGHEVTLFATRDSKTSGELHAFFPRPIRPYVTAWELIHGSEMLKHAHEFDIIHNHIEGVVPFLGFAGRPTLTTIHNPLARHELPFFSYYADGNYVALTEYHRKKIANLPRVWVINNGIDPQEYPFSDQKEDFLLFVGYFAERKGADIAIEVAKKLGQRLIIIAKLDPVGIQQEYYKTRIAPHVDGEQICYLGELGEERKDYFQKAKCLLFPTRGQEPFGLPMIEAMACGTPVIGFKRASVPEIVCDGETGFLADDVEAMTRAVGRLGTIDPSACREHVLRHFSVNMMVERYLDVYEQLLAARAHART